MPSFVRDYYSIARTVLTAALGSQTQLLTPNMPLKMTNGFRRARSAIHQISDIILNISATAILNSPEKCDRGRPRNYSQCKYLEYWPQRVIELSHLPDDGWRKEQTIGFRGETDIINTIPYTQQQKTRQK
jgi:hypothetical protein